MKNQKVIERRARVADLLREDIRGLDRKTRTKQPVVKRDVTERHGARRGVPDRLTEPKILEEVASDGFGGRGRAHK
jgi:hypothetical protein